MRPSGSPQALERRRRHAISLFQDGYRPVEIARKTRCWPTERPAMEGSFLERRMGGDPAPAGAGPSAQAGA